MADREDGPQGYEGLDDRRLAFAPEDTRAGGWKCLREVAVEFDDPHWLSKRAPHESAPLSEVLRWFIPLRVRVWMCVHCGARLRRPIEEWSPPRSEADPHMDGACLRSAPDSPFFWRR